MPRSDRAAVENRAQEGATTITLRTGRTAKDMLQQIWFGRTSYIRHVQSLYETHKIVTYPRVDTGYLPENMHSEAPAILRAMLQSDAQLGQLMTLV